ncbi:hypothetical protein Malapachy_16210 [Malassezia pachydermatis]|uniref:Palmitoyltransferase PFA4 n=1 Tax=Malassezia pachydermatis TaxID=77020 RepID=A0A0M8MK09_9BASI|nr:hypothetical protein Malapachy_16210 [Malassezia pachydermatis]KOS13108.1 hypothetical protein Malapachy_16210 [Malassezia pachydermatis]
MSAEGETQPTLAQEAASGESEVVAPLLPSTPPASTTPTTSVTRPRAMLRPYEIVWVAGVIAVMVFLHVTSQVFIMWPYYRSTPSFTFAQLMRVLIPLNLLGAYMYYAYYMCLTSDPGGVPVDWRQPPEVHSGWKRYCYKCHAYKPPRAHHCRVCRRCVLRMDHHCPWIGNCVGYGTYLHFLKYTTGVVIAITFHLTMITLRVFDYWNFYHVMPRPSTMEAVMIVLNYMLGIPTIALVTFLTLYHYYLLATNTTSIESWEKDRVARQIRRGQIPFTRFPFDVGCWPNICAVLGPHVLLWPWLRRSPGDGLHFDVSSKDSDAQYAWPPQDPRTYLQHRRRRHRPKLMSPFTYGDEQLNPNLQASRQGHTQPQAQAHATLRHRPPMADADTTAAMDDGFYDSYSSEGESDHDSASEHEMAVPSGTVRVRRGSEGFEVRPPHYGRALWEQFGAEAFPAGTEPPPEAGVDGRAWRP